MLVEFGGSVLITYVILSRVIVDIHMHFTYFVVVSLKPFKGLC